MTKTITWVVGNENSMKSTRQMSSAASTIPSAMPGSPDERRDDALVPDHPANLAARHADRASIPISRVRSNTVSTSVFTMPNRLTMIDSASST